MTLKDTRTAPGAVTRDKILASALALFAGGGYADSSMADIAQFAGVSKALLFHHFGSKAGLLDAIVAPLVPAYQNMVDDIASYDGPSNRVAYALEKHLDFVGTHGRTYSFVLRHAAEVSGHKSVQSLQKLGKVLEHTLLGSSPTPAAMAALQVAFLGTTYAWIDLSTARSPAASHVLGAGMAVISEFLASQ